MVVLLDIVTITHLLLTFVSTFKMIDSVIVFAVGILVHKYVLHL